MSIRTNMSIRTKLNLFCAGLTGMSLLAACTPPGEGPAATPQEALERAAEGRQPAQGVPAGAVMVEDGLYAVPIAVDAGGCEQFSLWSPGGAVAEVIHFRDGEGGFSPTRTPGSCGAVMVSAGQDETGCPQFAIEQPDGALTEARFYERAGGGYGTNRSGAACP
jgi:hypothetical protein